MTTKKDELTDEEKISEAIGLAATWLIRNNKPVTARELSQLLKFEEEKTADAGHKIILAAARKLLLRKMQ